MSTVATLPGYYTITEAAEIIGVSHAQVSRYIKNDLLKAIDLGHQKMIEQSAVHQFKRKPVGNPAFKKQQKTKTS